MKPRRLRLSRKLGYRKPPDAVNVTRQGKLGNPFNWKPYLDQFRGDEKKAKQLAKARYEIYRLRAVAGLIEPLRGKDIVCWCRLCEKHQDGLPLGVECSDCDPCHGDVILREANR